MRGLEEQIRMLMDAGLINEEEFNRKVEQYKNESPARQLAEQNAALMMMVAEKEMTILEIQEQQATVLMVLAEKGVL
ncbi:hypothetical protein [Bacillus mobilis]|uniref:SHOCT domain-containing protein n=1 Tax=Bacillus mobilis TaxID=2026190 RepID=A0A1Y5YW46_9BACI|nr:hypothetical protein [Bacillus mobilis]MCU5595093.1 hypothetical protein [Bacillus mobilis]MCU5737688.1 hypothetical protein [Bacillus mobilis]SMD65647.1 hypothetical protein BACERE00185_00053 [Bacillus mobilis]